PLQQPWLNTLRRHRNVLNFARLQQQHRTDESGQWPPSLLGEQADGPDRSLRQHLQLLALPVSLPAQPLDPPIPIPSDEYNEEALPDHLSRYHGYRPITYAVQLLVLGARARRVQ